MANINGNIFLKLRYIRTSHIKPLFSDAYFCTNEFCSFHGTCMNRTEDGAPMLPKCRYFAMIILCLPQIYHFLQSYSLLCFSVVLLGGSHRAKFLTRDTQEHQVLSTKKNFYFHFRAELVFFYLWASRIRCVCTLYIVVPRKISLLLSKTIWKCFSS